MLPTPTRLPSILSQVFGLDEFFLSLMGELIISSPFCMIEPSWKMLLSRRPRWEVVVWICKMQTRSQLILTVFRKELSRTTCLTFVWPSAVEKHLLKCFRCSQWLCLLWVRLNIQICNFYPNKGDVFCISDAVSLWWTIKMWIEIFFCTFCLILKRCCSLQETENFKSSK